MAGREQDVPRLVSQLGFSELLLKNGHIVLQLVSLFGIVLLLELFDSIFCLLLRSVREVGVVLVETG